ncbi:hypothetical protein LOD99_15594 [Oopsacas minuta]|uniref:Uncharacterized protein n=1 Tax=Oopsacas minuta TaxID=111878 RepID=A0AAV7KBM3_9METZ|nr:hypothetical protein LOD99_15594 [Oopsacas minuta]
MKKKLIIPALKPAPMAPKNNVNKIKRRYTFSSSPIRTRLSHSPPEVFQPHQAPSPIPQPSLKLPSDKTFKRYKPPMAKIFHPKKNQKTRETIDSQIYDGPVPLPKRIKIQPIFKNKKKKEYKSLRVEDGTMEDVKVSLTETWS